jgi:thiamine biosynthesis lipoprotein
MNSSNPPDPLSAHPAIRRMVPVLGTFVRMELRSPRVDPETLGNLVSKAYEVIHSIQKQMSYFEPESDVSQFNRAKTGDWLNVRSNTFQVLKFADTLFRETDGVFNVGLGEDWMSPVYEIDMKHQRIRKTQKGEMDLGGIAKGFAVDEAYRIIHTFAETDEVYGSINAGGDLFLFEEHPVMIPVQVGVGEAVHHRMLELKRGAVATSSVNPNVRYRKQNQFVIENPMTACVVAPTTMVADALTKVVLLAQNEAEKALAKKCLKAYDARGYYENHDYEIQPNL